MLPVRIVLVVAILGTLGWRLCKIAELEGAIASRTSVVSIPYNDAVQKATEVRLDQSRSRAQVTIIFLGLLGALWVAKRDAPQLTLSRHFWPEIVIWVAVVAMLIVGLYCHNEYLDNIATALESGGVTSGKSVSIPNVFDPKYETLLAEQFRLLLLGSGASVLALFSVWHLAGGRDVRE